MKKTLVLLILLGGTALIQAQSSESNIINKGIMLQDQVQHFEKKLKRINRSFWYYGGATIAGGIIYNTSNDPFEGQLLGTELAVIGGMGLQIQLVRVLLVKSKLSEAQFNFDLFLLENNAVELPNGTIRLKEDEH